MVTPKVSITVTPQEHRILVEGLKLLYDVVVGVRLETPVKLMNEVSSLAVKVSVMIKNMES